MIKFGTDGWRALIAKDFTFDNVAVVSAAFARYYKDTDQPVYVGYDNRFLSKDFAVHAARVITSFGIKTFISSSPCPSQTVSFHVKEKKAAAGVMITASHNPAQWNGFKIKGPYGGSATPEITKKIEEMISVGAGSRLPLSDNPSPSILEFDPKEGYIKKIQSLIDLERIKDASPKILIDPMHGSGTGYLPEILKGYLLAEEINTSKDAFFGGVNPEPIPPNVNKLLQLCGNLAVTGIALDGDADRVGACTSKGVFINTHQIFVLLMYHLIKNKKWTGAVVKTFNMTKLVDKMASYYKIKTYETPIGFKNVCDLMLKEDILMGGEESGGYGFKNHIPERDGILAGLYLLELMAYEKKSLEKVLDDIAAQFGRYCYNRLDIHLEDEKKNMIMDMLTNRTPKEFGGAKVISVENMDGIKLNLEGNSWILFRASGTEPLLRIYCESTSNEKVAHYLDEGKRLALS